MKISKPTPKQALIASTILGSVVLAGCGNEDFMPQLRVIHASPDAPPVNVKVSSKRTMTEINNLDYAESSGYQTVRPGRRNISVEAIIPGGNAEVISVPGFRFKPKTYYNILAVENTADIEPLLVKESAAKPASDEVAVALVHASPDAPEVDVYVTAPGTDISDPSVMPRFSFDFKDPAVDAGAVPATSYDIAVTLKGTKTVAYDIADVDLSPFAGQKLLIAAVSTTTATNQAASPIKLLVATDDAQVTLLDKDTTAGARVVHLSPDADAVATSVNGNSDVEVLASSTTLGLSGLELIDAFSYTDTAPPVGNPPLPLTGDSSFVLVPPADDFIFDVAVDGGTPVAFTSGELALSAGSEYSVIASGLITRAPAFDLLVTEESNRSIITQASVKVVHGAPAAGTVSVYVTPAGTYTKEQIETAFNSNDPSIPPLLQGFEFGEITGYVPVSPGDYDIRVVPNALGVAAINVEGFTLPQGLVATVIARQPNDPVPPATTGTPDDFGLLVLTN